MTITTIPTGESCQACGKTNSMTFYRIVIHRLIVILCPFCMGHLSNEFRKHDDQTSGY